MLSVCGNRFGRGFLKIGRNNFSFDSKAKNIVNTNLRKVRDNMEMLCEEMFDSPSVLSRIENTGVLTKQQVIDNGFTGLTARASGVKYDVRNDHPFGAYKQHPVYPLSLEGGDVFSRAFLRYLEMQQSMNFIEEIMKTPNVLKISNNESYFDMPDNIMAVSMTEGWRGEIVHAVVKKSAESIRYKVKDPSFNNWFALALAVRNNGISDFPLCNKSFNLSYAGNDL